MQASLPSMLPSPMQEQLQTLRDDNAGASCANDQLDEEHALMIRLARERERHANILQLLITSSINRYV
jgi:hypothetical protein